jgi:hypothetical protein
MLDRQYCSVLARVTIVFAPHRLDLVIRDSLCNYPAYQSFQLAHKCCLLGKDRRVTERL